MSKWLTALLFKRAKQDEGEIVYTKIVYMFFGALSGLSLVLVRARTHVRVVVAPGALRDGRRGPRGVWGADEVGVLLCGPPLGELGSCWGGRAG